MKEGKRERRKERKEGRKEGRKKDEEKERRKERSIRIQSDSSILIYSFEPSMSEQQFQKYASRTPDINLYVQHHRRGNY